jgi:DNA replication protein DnaC
MEPIGDVLKRMPAQTAKTGVATPSPEPACTICGGAGYLRLDVPIDDLRFGEMVACECTVRELNAKRMQHLLERSNLGPLRGKTFANYVVDSRTRPKKNSPEAAYKGAVAFAERPDRSEAERQEKPRREWLVLAGNHGTGKTHLAVAIANHRLDRGSPAIFIVVPDLLDRLRATFGPSSDVTYDELFESAREVELLVLDDLGAQSSTPWAQEKLYQIINERYNRRLPTVITSNLRLDDTEMRLRSRIGDTTLADNYWIQAPDVRLGVEPSEQVRSAPMPRSRPVRG